MYFYCALAAGWRFSNSLLSAIPRRCLLYYRDTNMTKALGIFILQLLFVTTLTFGQSTDKEFLKTVSEKQANDDIDSLCKWVEEIHPNMFENTSKSNFQKLVSNTKEKIYKPLTVRELYKLISPLLTSLKDAHTGLHSPYFVTEEKSNLFPLLINLSANQKELIVGTAVDKSFLNQVPIGSTIKSINGISSSKIIEDISKLISYETKVFFATRFKNLFSSLLYCQYDFQKTFTVEYLHNKKLKMTKLVNNTFKIISKNFKNEDYSLSFRKKYAFLTINSFGVSNEEDYFSFLTQSFQKIKENNIKKLVIDIRYNDGGNSVLGDSLLSFISSVPFKQFDSTFYKHSRIQKKLFNKIYKNDTLFIKSLNNFEDGFIEETNGGNLIVPNKIDKQFKGKIFLLVSNFTFSSGANFAWAFKNYKLGTVVGQETGGIGICFGDGVPFLLPNSKISGQSASQKFKSIGASDNNFNGLIPDIKTIEKEELKVIQAP